MKNWKALCKRILYPPWWLTLLLTVGSAAALVKVFLSGWEESPVAYVIYVTAFYSLTVVCLSAYTILPGWYRRLKETVYRNPLGNRYFTDAAFQTGISLGLSLLVNLLYAATNGLFFLQYRSAWFVVLLAYYMILAVMRFLLVRYVRRTGIGKNLIGELRRSRLCAMILMLVNLVLSGAVLMMLYQNKGYVYPGILVYVMALYTFYITIHAIVDVVKYRKYNSPVMSAAKVITLSAALVSMLNLETAMFSQFGGDMSPANQRRMIALTGAGVSAVVVSMSIFLIVRGTQRIRELRES